eukprot:CAMPEP_0197033696 /NCGR_PEP_ID=MMETSP1384-20130603/12036_1 /TAXON_ID=29189 /ORGANISM="Ammonia sp." /LENGTH=846 /DNA_ID=CAMNT_0042463539 /DNA_START=45 /DNA_END=2585 /DNA_ORIENTATION=-
MTSSSPYSTSKSYATAHLTPQQQAIHQQTIYHHLSNRRLPGQQFSSPVTPITPIATVHTSNPRRAQHAQQDDEWEEKSLASQSRSILRDLPIFPKGSAKQEKGDMRKVHSDPALSKAQKEKRETGLYMHPAAFPRSLSEGYLGYSPPMELQLVMDLPMDAYMGVGGGKIKSLLQSALRKIDLDLEKMELEEQKQAALGVEEEEDAVEDLRIRSPEIHASQAIPMAPDTIPPDAVEDDLSSKKERDAEDFDEDIYPVPYKGADERRKSSLEKGGMKRVDSRAIAQNMKRQIEQALKQTYTRNLIIAVIQALTGAFLYGWNVSLLNIPQTVVQEATGMSDDQFALLSSMFCVGGLIGALSAGRLQDGIGRKKALLLIDCIFLASAALTFVYAEGWLGAIDDSTLYFAFWTGRFLVGIACGAATAVVPTYLGEISPPLIRGAVGTSNQLTICFSIVIVEFFGYKAMLGGTDTWSLLFLGNAVPCLQLLTAWSFPESPKWLVQKGRDKEARKALQKLRQTDDVDIDMMLMKGGMLHEEKAHTSPKVVRKSFKKKQQGIAGGDTNPLLDDVQPGLQQERGVDFYKDEGQVGHAVVNMNGDGAINTKTANKGSLRKKSKEKKPTPSSKPVGSFGIELEMWKAVKWSTIIAISLMFMQQMSGINAVFFYSSTFIAQAGLTSDLDKWLGSVAISLANFLAVFIAVFSIDRAGRKMLLIISCIVMGCAAVLVSIAMEFSSEHGDAGTAWKYSSIVFLVLFVVGFEIGLGAIPWLMMAELAPMQYRGTIVAMATGANWAFNGVIAQFSAQIVKMVKFYPFAAVCGAGIAFTIKYIPETNGKSAAEIQKELTNTKAC